MSAAAALHLLSQHLGACERAHGPQRTVWCSRAALDALLFYGAQWTGDDPQPTCGNAREVRLRVTAAVYDMCQRGRQAEAKRLNELAAVLLEQGRAPVLCLLLGVAAACSNDGSRPSGRVLPPPLPLPPAATYSESSTYRMVLLSVVGVPVASGDAPKVVRSVLAELGECGRRFRALEQFLHCLEQQAYAGQADAEDEVVHAFAGELRRLLTSVWAWVSASCARTGASSATVPPLALVLPVVELVRTAHSLCFRPDGSDSPADASDRFPRGADLLTVLFTRAQTAFIVAEPATFEVL